MTILECSFAITVGVLVWRWLQTREDEDAAVSMLATVLSDERSYQIHRDRLARAFRPEDDMSDNGLVIEAGFCMRSFAHKLKAQDQNSKKLRHYLRSLQS